MSAMIEDTDRRAFIYNFFSEVDKAFREALNDTPQRLKRLAPLFQKLLSVPSPVTDAFLALETTQKVWTEPETVSDEELIVFANLVFLHALMIPVALRTKAFAEILPKINHLIFHRLMLSDLVWEKYGAYGIPSDFVEGGFLLDLFFQEKGDEIVGPFVWEVLWEVMRKHDLTGQILRWSASDRFSVKFCFWSDVCEVAGHLLKDTPTMPVDDFLQILSRINCRKLIGAGNKALEDIRGMFKKSQSKKIVSWLLNQESLLGDGVSYYCFTRFFNFLKKNKLDESIPIFFAQVDWASKSLDMDFWLSEFLKKLEPSYYEILFRQSSFLTLIATPAMLLKVLNCPSLPKNVNDFPESLREIFARIDPLKIFDTRGKLLILLQSMITIEVSEEKFNSTVLVRAPVSRAFVFGNFCDSLTGVEDPSLDCHPV